MPIIKDLTIRLEDQPGTLGKGCRALADKKMNIVALQSIPSEGRGLVRFVVDIQQPPKRFWTMKV